jgi:hypothetical protein
MPKIISTMKRVLIASSVIILATSFTPAAIFADSSSTPTPCAIPLPTGPGVHRPVGADASTYTYNCNTGLWQNAYYTFDPNTGIVTPTYTIVYTYDPSAGLYDYSTWGWDAGNGQYVSNPQTIAQPPAGADVVGAPVVVSNTGAGSNNGTDGTGGDGSSISNTGDGSNNTIDNNGGVGGGSIDNTGADSDNSLAGSSINDLTDNNTNNATINNLLGQNASTGDSTVFGNTTGGNASTGDAQDVVNAVNMLQSSSDALGGNAVTFVANINGNVDGNLLIDPSTLGAVQPTSDPAGTNNLTVDNSTNAAINNNINLAAASGDATVADNTTGGNATSGSAETIADVVNLIDSAISSGQSFVGVININGDLNGNIDIPPNLVNQLIADNVPTVTISDTGADSNNSITSTGSNNTKVTNTNNEGITNNVNSTAASGQAAVTENTTAGNATSGNASNNITAFNLTGSNVIGANDLLVFVNVLGTWVGMIMNAPAGATAAELGGGITQDSQGNNNTTINNNANQTINNNITTNAQSGKATVDQNTTGGNATSGNASNAVNLLNVENSSLSLSGWFGILFINVFGTWNGNFGIYNPLALNSGANSSDASSSSAGAPSQPPVFSFVSHAPGSSPASSISNTGSGSDNSVANSILAARLTEPANPTPQLRGGSDSLLLPATGIALFVAYVFGDFLYSRRQKRARVS